MKTKEAKVAYSSEYFIYSPSRTATKMFLYPLQCGLFIYEKGYTLNRKSFDSFLVAYIKKGEMTFGEKSNEISAKEGSFILLDCYMPHSYRSQEGAECLWCHFDGKMARNYFELVHEKAGTVFTFNETRNAVGKLTAIFNMFSLKKKVNEALLHKYLTDIITEFLLFNTDDKNHGSGQSMSEDVITFINAHYTEDITIDEMADLAGLSKFHFIRKFRTITGFTPHEYLMNTRFLQAKYLLKSTVLSVKEICFSTGFSNESVFTSAFKKEFGISPLQYRNS
ncbi:MAG: AraC family transcriptional regulator [Treponema sp.]|nr:AraC family transcriptional regulator [Treponema sp.]